MNLKPCPHCGSRVEIKEIPGSMSYWPEIGLKCTGCPINFFLGYDELSGKGDETRTKLVDSWNRRVN